MIGMQESFTQGRSFHYTKLKTRKDLINSLMEFFCFLVDTP